MVAFVFGIPFYRQEGCPFLRRRYLSGAMDAVRSIKETKLTSSTTTAHAPPVRARFCRNLVGTSVRISRPIASGYNGLIAFHSNRSDW